MNPASLREDDILHVYQTFKPDIIGFQELNGHWYTGSLLKYFSEEYCFVGTEIYNNSVHTPMAIKKEYELWAKGFERLSDTPDDSKSITWAVIRKKGEENYFAVCNTHFWWMENKEEHDLLRVKNAKQLTELMHYIASKYSCPVFAMGDMNCTIASEVFRVYRENGIHHLYDLAQVRDDVSSYHLDPVLGEDGRFHGKTAAQDSKYSIDHIVVLGEGIEVSQYRVVEMQEALDATDHSPVYADIVI